MLRKQLINRRIAILILRGRQGGDSWSKQREINKTGLGVKYIARKEEG